MDRLTQISNKDNNLIEWEGVPNLKTHLYHTTSQGFLYAVNLSRYEYSIKKDNKFLEDIKNNYKKLFNLNQVTFIGNFFYWPTGVNEGLSYFKVKYKKIYIPFKVEEVSDIRHVFLPCLLDVDYLPVVLLKFETIKEVLSKLKLLKVMRYFILNKKTTTDNDISILKENFPWSKVILYELEDIESLIKSSLKDTRFLALSDSIRTTDYFEKNNITALSKNPLFALRYYLRELDWKNLWSIPEKTFISLKNIQDMFIIMKIVKARENTAPDLQKNNESFNQVYNFYQILHSIYTLEGNNLKQYLQTLDIDLFLLNIILRVLDIQKKITPLESLLSDSFFDLRISLLLPTHDI